MLNRKIQSRILHASLSISDSRPILVLIPTTVSKFSSLKNEFENCHQYQFNENLKGLPVSDVNIILEFYFQSS